MEEESRPNRRQALKKGAWIAAALGFAYGVQRGVEKDVQDYYRPVRERFKKMEKVEYDWEGKHFVFPTIFEKMRSPVQLSDVEEMRKLFGISAAAVEKGGGITLVGCYLEDGKEQWIASENIQGHAQLIARVLYSGKKCEITLDDFANGHSR